MSPDDGNASEGDNDLHEDVGGHQTGPIGNRGGSQPNVGNERPDAQTG